MAQINKLIDNRSLIRVTNRSGHAKGLVGIALGYNPNYHSIKVGMVDDAGKYTGDYVKVSADCIETISQALTGAAEVTEALRIRLWLIEQALTPIDVQDDPAGIVGIVGPYLDGPIHPTDRAAYRAARTTTVQGA